MPISGSALSRSGTNSTRPRPRRASTSSSVVELGVVGVARRHLAAGAVLVEERRRQPPRARGHRSVEDVGHARALVGGRGALPRVVAHHHEPQWRVAHERGDVHAGAACVDGVAVAGVVLPRPRHVVDQRVGGHVLDEGEHVGDRDALLVGDREQRERAVADQRGGDAVLRLRVARGVPEHLRVEVGVQVEEAGGDDRTGGVELGFAVAGEVGADLGDPAGAHPDDRRRRRVRRCRRRRCHRGRGDHVRGMPWEEDGTPGRGSTPSLRGQKGSGDGKSNATTSLAGRASDE